MRGWRSSGISLCKHKALVIELKINNMVQAKKTKKKSSILMPPIQVHFINLMKNKGSSYLYIQPSLG